MVVVASCFLFMLFGVSIVINAEKTMPKDSGLLLDLRGAAQAARILIGGCIFNVY